MCESSKILLLLLLCRQIDSKFMLCSISLNKIKSLANHYRTFWLELAILLSVSKLFSHRWEHKGLKQDDMQLMLFLKSQTIQNLNFYRKFYQLWFMKSDSKQVWMEFQVESLQTWCVWATLFCLNCSNPSRVRQ